jgi:hypothetical protein
MTRIVRDQFPVDRLPDELRAGLGDATHVRITVEDKAADADLLADLDAKLHKAMADIDAGMGLSAEQVKASLRVHADGWSAKAK